MLDVELQLQGYGSPMSSNPKQIAVMQTITFQVSQSKMLAKLFGWNETWYAQALSKYAAHLLWFQALHKYDRQI